MSHHHRRAAAVSAPDPFFSNTVLLLSGNGTNGGQNNTFVDSSTNNFTVTRFGNTTQGSFSPFTGAGGSGYFDGSGDYLSAPSNSAFDFGTGDFTIECWAYFTSLPSFSPIVTRWNPKQWYLAVHGSTSIRYYVGNDVLIINASKTFTTGQWYHIALVRISGTSYIYVDGTQVGSGADTTNFSSGTSTVTVGVNGGFLSYAMNGYISSLRILKGTAQYTANFTPPTSPLTAITNTSLMFNFTNASIIDSTSKNNLETVGNAQISTSVKKFGTGSMAFDGTGDWLLIRDNADLRFGTGNFTIECWLYLSATGSARGIVAKGTSTTGWMLSTNTSNQVFFTYSSSTITSTGTLSGSTWYHLAVVRSGTGTNQVKIYIDGTNDGTGTVSTDFNQTNNAYVGADRTGGTAMNGNIDHIRITKGIARYTANFTPPYRQLPPR